MASDFSDNRGVSRAQSLLAAIGVLLAAALTAWLVISVVMPSVREQGAISLRNAIVQSANQCYAIEGAYPYSLGYLEQNYGLVVNHDDYSITYEVFADNVAPSIMVVAK